MVGHGGFVFIRHGRAADIEGRCIGQTDVPLSTEGISEIRALARRWSTVLPEVQPSRVVSSDLRRAADSASLLAAEWHLPVQYDAALREMSFGEWDGQLWSLLESADGDRLASWMRAWTDAVTPGGEGARDVVARASAWLARESATASNEWIATIAHAGWIRAALCVLLDTPVADMFSIPVDHARVTVVQCDGTRAVLLGSNLGPSDSH